MPQSAKDRWNAAHYKQMKFSTPPLVAKVFKETCKEQGISMASAIVKFMRDFSTVEPNASKTIHTSIADTGTRRARRKIMHNVINSVASIYDAETIMLERTPESFQGGDRYAETERIVEALETALESLKEVYALD